MINNNNKNHVIDTLFTLTLFGVFAVSALLIVILGANVYKETVSDMTRNYNTRTSISYLAEKLRQSDTVGSIAVSTVEGRDALVLTRSLENRTFETWIYTGGGELREVMVVAGTQVKASDGQAIMPIGSLSLKLGGNLLTMIATDPDGEISDLTLGIRCGVTSDKVD